MLVNELATKQDLIEVKDELMEEIRKLIAPQSREAIYYKSNEVRQMLKCSDSTLQHLRKSGKLPATKVGGVYMYSKSSIDNLFDTG